MFSPFKLFWMKIKMNFLSGSSKVKTKKNLKKKLTTNKFKLKCTISNFALFVLKLFFIAIFPIVNKNKRHAFHRVFDKEKKIVDRIMVGKACAVTSKLEECICAVYIKIDYFFFAGKLNGYKNV